jgi:hypothetical protein
MSCTLRIKDPTKPVTIKFECMACGKEIDLEEPIFLHETCVDMDDKLPVEVIYTNTES